MKKIMKRRKFVKTAALGQMGMIAAPAIKYLTITGQTKSDHMGHKGNPAIALLVS